MLVNPEDCDTSEQRFEDSLITSPVAEYRSIQVGPERNQNSAEPATNESDIENREITGAPPDGIAKRAAEEDLRSTGDWRDEISSRLNNYARRRGRKRLAGEFSMQLDFERPRRSNAATAAALDRIMESAPQQEGAPVATSQVAYDPDPDWNYSPLNVESAVEPEPKTELPGFDAIEAGSAVPEKQKPRRTHHRIIEFPRLFPIDRNEQSSDELAETLDRPRILDVPEETEQIVLPLADISLEMQQQAEEAVVPTREFELPIQVASMSQRAFAAIADTTLVLCGTALFAGIVLNVAKGLPHNKLMLTASLVIPCVLWAVYHYLFLVHSATTPGMKIAQLRLSTVGGQPTNRHIRRARALALMLSLASAGMGFGWALVDEDTLCWHDRISRTYLTNK